MASSRDIVERTIKRAGEQMEAEWKVARAEDAERLYNAIAVAVSEEQPRVEVLVYVLEMMKVEVLTRRVREEFPPAGSVAPIAPSNGHIHAREVG